MKRRSRLSATCSTMKAPGVSKMGAPPAADTEYRCGHSSRYAMKTIRSPAAQCRFASPATSGKEPARVLGLFQATRPAPSFTEATQIDQGCGTLVRTGCGGPPAPGRRVNAMRVPSDDQTGDSSLLVEGARYDSGVLFEV